MVQLMMGGITPRHGFPLHCRLRYFDAARQRPGVPQGVAALVTVTLTAWFSSSFCSPKKRFSRSR